MIIIKVELHSAITGKVTELARMRIINDETGNMTRRNYIGQTYRGRNTKDLDKYTIMKGAALKNWPSAQFHVWNLVRAMLTQLGYTNGQST